MTRLKTAMNRETLCQWLDLALDGELGRKESTRLDAQLAADPELAAERCRLESLHVLLRQSRIPVRAGFRDEVLAALPAPAWQPSRVPVWALPLAMMVVLGVAAAAVIGGGGTATPAAEGPLVGTALAILDFLQVTALAGAGLAAASWQGFGMVLEELIASSSSSLAAMVVFVLLLNLLFLSMMRRRPAIEVHPILENTAGKPQSD